MKIAVIGAKGIPAKYGGIERYCQELYPQIVARGHEVDLYVQHSYHRQSWFSTFVYQRMKVIALPSLPTKQFKLLNSAISTIWATFGNYDVIHIHGITAAWFAWFAKALSNSSVIMTCHQLESELISNKAFHWLFPWLEKMAVTHIDEMVVTSQELSNYFFYKHGISPQYIANAPAKYTAEKSNYSCRQAFSLDRSNYLLYSGTFEPDCGIDLLIKAFQKLNLPDWKLVLAGDISHSLQYSIKLLQMARREDNIIFTGEIGGNLLEELVRGADIFVNPSQDNNLSSPVLMLEAMREGIPVVACDTRSNRQLLGRDRGLLFHSGQFDSLLAQLEYAISQPKLLSTMAKKAQTYIAVHHNWDKVIYQNLFLYLQLTTKISLQSRSPYQSLDG